MPDQSARAVLQAALDQYGLGSLAEWAWNRYLETGSTDQVFLELRQQSAYRQRFPAMEALSRSGRAISEASYIEYERTVTQTLHQYGIPRGMYDTPDAIANLLVNDVSAPRSTTASGSPRRPRCPLRRRSGMLWRRSTA